ncbi:MAG: hypothetical protein U9Q83_01815 [Bacteroidota bacterium]|nr:hypothetical protein [Bacteroidota bacterium]
MSKKLFKGQAMKKYKITTWERCECGSNKWYDKSYGDNIEYVCVKCGNTFEA